MDERDRSFISRWSRLKRSGGGEPESTPNPPRGTAPADRGSTSGEAARPTGPHAEPASEATELPLDIIERIDLATLDAASDFKPFMQGNVPAELRAKALARLWESDATLARPDPFFEYGGDYTDAAVAVAGGLIQTAYKVGQGFLSDEEAAEWDRLGKEPDQTAGADPAVAIAPETPDQPAVRAFFAESEAYMAALYPAASNHFLGLDALLAPDVVFLVARKPGETADEPGSAIGCGALVPCGDGGSAEIKRMWVTPSARGQGVGRRMLAALEDAARGRGLAVLRLETGIAQPEAIALYRAAGYVEREAFAPYAPDPLSLFMEKRLG